MVRPAGIEPATLSLEFGPTKRAIEVQDPWCAEYGNVNPFHAPRITLHYLFTFHDPYASLAGVGQQHSYRVPLRPACWNPPTDRAALDQASY